MLPYRTILYIVTILSLLSVAGMRQIGSALFFSITMINISMWSWPHIAKWLKEKNKYALEGEKQLHAGNYKEAEAALLMAVDDAELRRRRPLKRAELLSSLAEAQRRLGKFGEAEATAVQAMALVADGEAPSRAAQCLDLLAGIHEDQGNYPQAQEFLLDSLKIEEELPKPNPRILARRLQRLALAHHLAGDYAGAAPHFARSLEQHERAFGAEHAETGKALSDLGIAMLREGKHEESTQKLRQALAIQESALGSDAPEVSDSVFHLALAYERAGNLEVAADVFERALALRERIVRGSNLEVGVVLYHLARVYLAMGKLARAEESAKSALAILERTPEPELASTYETLAAIYGAAGRSAEAHEAAKRAREATV
jgi:tetratricopeptide (TPR) repeat protein